VIFLTGIAARRGLSWLARLHTTASAIGKSKSTTEKVLKCFTARVSVLLARKQKSRREVKGGLAEKAFTSPLFHSTGCAVLFITSGSLSGLRLAFSSPSPLACYASAAVNKFLYIDWAFASVPQADLIDLVEGGRAITQNLLSD
jgi:hypothetical protein